MEEEQIETTEKQHPETEEVQRVTQPQQEQPKLERPRTSDTNRMSRFLQHKRRTDFMRQRPGTHSSNWNPNFHVVQSKNNFQSHGYFKEFFDKPARMRDIKLLSPFKFRDPYINDGSRIPRHSKVAKKSHLFDELSWTPHFTVMHSKNNERIHPAYKEFFDSPVNYQVKGHQFSARIPPGKVYQNRFGSTSFSLRTSRFRREATQGNEKFFKGASRSIMQTTRKDVSQKEVRNLLRDQKIPYLREPRLKSPKLSSREKAWSPATGYPISKYNETVYPQYKIMFEHI